MKRFKFRWLDICLVVFAILCFVVYLVPALREGLVHLVDPNPRRVISTVSGDLKGDGTKYFVIKIRTPRGLKIEIYEEDEKNGKAKAGEFEFPNAKDTYLNAEGETSNLILKDISGDGVPDIVVPFIDSNMDSQINSYYYNTASGKFLLYKP